MLSLDRDNILCYLYSSDDGGLLIGHTDVLSRTEEHRGENEVRLARDLNKFSFYLSLKRPRKF